MEEVLQRIRVLDFSRYASGPYCAVKVTIACFVTSVIKWFVFYVIFSHLKTRRENRRTFLLQLLTLLWDRIIRQYKFARTYNLIYHSLKTD